MKTVVSLALIAAVFVFSVTVTLILNNGDSESGKNSDDKKEKKEEERVGNLKRQDNGAKDLTKSSVNPANSKPQFQRISSPNVLTIENVTNSVTEIQQEQIAIVAQSVQTMSPPTVTKTTKTSGSMTTVASRIKSRIKPARRHRFGAIAEVSVVDPYMEDNFSIQDAEKREQKPPTERPSTKAKLRRPRKHRVKQHKKSLHLKHLKRQHLVKHSMRKPAQKHHTLKKKRITGKKQRSHPHKWRRRHHRHRIAYDGRKRGNLKTRHHLKPTPTEMSNPDNEIPRKHGDRAMEKKQQLSSTTNAPTSKAATTSATPAAPSSPTGPTTGIGATGTATPFTTGAAMTTGIQNGQQTATSLVVVDNLVDYKVQNYKSSKTTIKLLSASSSNATVPYQSEADNKRPRPLAESPAAIQIKIIETIPLALLRQALALQSAPAQQEKAGQQSQRGESKKEREEFERVQRQLEDIA